MKIILSVLLLTPFCGAAILTATEPKDLSEQESIKLAPEPDNLIKFDQCVCRSDYDCKRSPYCPNTCVIGKYSRQGTCKKVHQTKPPTDQPTTSPTPKPTPRPTPKPTRPPTKPTIQQGNCECQNDYDCQRSPYCPNKCVFSRYSGQGFCQNDDVEPTKAPISQGDPTQCCDDPRNIPTECEVRLLVEIMENAVGVNFAILPQWLRLSFHDAGTFDQTVSQGGANGCLLTHPPMRTMPENSNLDLALNTLAVIKSTWEGDSDTCLEVSAADMIQFAGWFSVIRQKDTPGLTAAKINELIAMTVWGRTDEPNCQLSWTSNLPGFVLGTDPSDIPARCKFAGGEIKAKMMDRNGFTAVESTALIGAHTIGLTRNVFGTGGPFVSKWAHNGGDNATPQGAVFDHGFHTYLHFDIVENNAFDFATNILAFDQDLDTWFRETATDIGHLDTDVALAFPSVDPSVHPDFHDFTEMFAADNNVFMDHFFQAFTKMSALGVTDPLFVALSCAEGCEGASASPVLTTEKKETIVGDIEVAVLEAGESIAVTQQARSEEISRLTTPVEKDIMK